MDTPFSSREALIATVRLDTTTPRWWWSELMHYWHTCVNDERFIHLSGKDPLDEFAIQNEKPTWTPKRGLENQ